jgi:peptidyl-prolyl cis-trans isomerase D
MKTQDINVTALNTVMKADTSKLPAYAGVEIPGKGYSVYRIVKVTQPANPDAERRQAEQRQIENTLAQGEMLAYVEVLKQKAKTKILKSVTSGAADGDDKPEADPEAK